MSSLKMLPQHDIAHLCYKHTRPPAVINLAFLQNSSFSRGGTCQNAILYPATTTHRSSTASPFPQLSHSLSVISSNTCEPSHQFPHIPFCSQPAMLRRSFLELSSLRSLRRIPRQIVYQPLEPALLSSQKGFSTSPPGGSNGEPPKSKSSLPKVLLGSTVVGGGALLAYQSGYLDQFIGRDSGKFGSDNKDGKQVGATISEESSKSSDGQEQVAHKVDAEMLPHAGVEEVETSSDAPYVKTHEDTSHVDVEKSVETQSDVPHNEALSEIHSEIQEIFDGKADDDKISVQEKDKPEVSEATDSDSSHGVETVESKTIPELNEGVQVTQVQTEVTVVPEEVTAKSVQPDNAITEDASEAAGGKGEAAAAKNLLDAYHLKEKAKESTVTNGSVKQAIVSAIDELSDGYVTKDGNLIMNFIEAIHEAEKRQADLDAISFAEEKRALMEKYEKELRDLRARELMLAEEAAMLDKEIKRERAKAAAAIRTLEEKMENKLQMELEHKERETEMKVKKIQELGKAEATARIASEKASSIEKMAEANLHIDALCMAFYARSEEARQIHSVHKLALGALALEDALSKGLPIQQEVDALSTYLVGTDKDSLLHLVLSTLPEETCHHGTDTLLQLNQKFKGLKETLRHYILIPPGGGGGILTHAASRIASWLRFKDVDPSGNGIESTISRVDNLLAEGKLAEAAEALEEGVKGSQAEEFAADWVTRARNRAITEQALMEERE